LQEDPRYSTNAARVAHRAELIGDLAGTLITRTKQEWIDLLLGVGVPAAPILDYGEAVVSEQAVARNMVQMIAHPIEGEFKALGFPVKMRGTPQEVRLPPPLLNEHSAEIRAELVAKGLLPALENNQ
jgi:crotonobetainyl-CoA:carnitine CoA-transferase CaiB-like acyl-CoA transferase